MHCPLHLTVHRGAGAAERIDAGFEGEGLRFQLDEVHGCLGDGRLESAVMPIDESLQLASTMDAILGQVGVSHPVA
jgi:hypothetical protein